MPAIAPGPRSAARTRRSAECVGFRLIYVARRWRQAVDAELDSYGLSHATWRPLLKLAFCEAPPRQHELADALQVSEPELVRLIDNLEEKGFVTRHDASEDRRVKRIQLTPAGRELADRADAILRRFEQRILRGIPTAERELLKDAFDRIEQRLDSFEPTTKPKKPRTP